MILAPAVLLAGCGSEQAAPPAPAPTSYYIRKVDLYRDAPNDICRAKDAAFLQDLIQRVVAALPPGTAGFDLEDFNATPAFDGKGMEAVLRFRVRGADRAPAMMYAVGPFDPATCTIGKLTGGMGPDAHDPRTKTMFTVP